jgi:hypothetical protein
MTTDRLRLLAILSVLLIAGFLAVSIGSYMVSRDSLRKSIIGHALPLTGDTIYSEIQKDILRPIFISSLMANDTFVRDWVLKLISDKVRGQLRKVDVMARWGGEEFMVLLKNCNLDNAPAVAEKQRVAVEAQILSPGPNGVRLTISLGVTQFVPGATADSLLSRADSALYLAKRNSRNRVEAAKA